MDLRMSIFFFSLVLYILYINNKQWKEKYLTSSVFGLLKKPLSAVVKGSSIPLECGF